MSIRHLLRHDVVIVRDTFAPTNDDWNQPVPATPTERHVRGFIQSRQGREMRQANDAGSVASTHVCFFTADTDIVASDRLYDASAPDNVYQVRFVAPIHSPRGVHHLRADIHLVTG